MQQNYINLWPSLITRNMIVDMQHNKYINMREIMLHVNRIMAHVDK